MGLVIKTKFVSVEFGILSGSNYFNCQVEIRSEHWFKINKVKSSKIPWLMLIQSLNFTKQAISITQNALPVYCLSTLPNNNPKGKS
jgi:hypothetical protein